MKAIVTVLLVLAHAAFTQTSDIGEIREYYNQVKEHLDDEYGLYRTEISINTGDKPYPALGHYQETITFFWDAEAGYEWPVLVIWSGEYSMHREYGEVLYSEPEDIELSNNVTPLFQYIAFHNCDDILTEMRWWYTDNELLDCSGRTTYPDEVYEFIPDIQEDYEQEHDPAELLELFFLLHK